MEFPKTNWLELGKLLEKVEEYGTVKPRSSKILLKRSNIPKGRMFIRPHFLYKNISALEAEIL